MNIGPEPGTGQLCGGYVLPGLAYIGRTDSNQGAMLENRLQGVEGGGNLMNSLVVVLLWGVLKCLRMGESRSPRKKMQKWWRICFLFTLIHVSLRFC